MTTSKSTLMHSCLAHLSPEIQTLDSIIYARPTLFSPHNIALPTEILLLIRESLFPLIVNRLVQQSTTALEAYEHSLRNLLCPDCIAYNLDIYGPNIWQWEQFHGACACLEIESPSSPRLRDTTTGGPDSRHGQRVQGHLSSKTTAHGTTTPSPKQFTDAQHWLESYLSREAALRVKFRGHQQTVTTAATSRPSAAPSTLDIWDAVALVLREYQCELIREPHDASTAALFHTDSAQSRRDFVQIVPSRHTSANNMDLEVPNSVNAIWRAQAVLRRATRDLCLERIEPFGAHNRDTSSFKRLLWHSDTSDLHHPREHFQMFIGLIASVAAGCVSLPITFTTVAITIVCFYSRPKCFRII